MLRIYSLLLFSLLAHALAAQEILLPVQKLPLEQQPIKKGDADVLTLPFFDDFSYFLSVPDPQKWEDDNVFVNNGFAKNLLTVGAATFDCLSSIGTLYGHLDYYNTYASDTLTSRPIDLSGATSVYLSFLYQGGGFGPAPAEEDTLVLQFYSQLEDQWFSVWKAAGAQHDEFQEAFVAVNEPRYLTGAFQFRFINYVTLGKDDTPSSRGNTDIWNLDYVFLDANRTEGVTTADDIYFTQPSTSFIQGYESVPWKHYLNNPTQLMSETFSVAIKNDGGTPKNINALNFLFTDEWGSGETRIKSAGTIDLEAEEFFERDYPNTGGGKFWFESTNSDSASFTVKTEMLLDETDFWEDNNAIYFQQVFADYYAYDDGIAEAGYGILGNGSSNAQVAYYYENQKPGDEMWGVDVFFTRTLNAANLKYFYLVVWEAINDSTPGEVLYRQPLAETLKYSDGMNAFNALRFHEEEQEWKDTAITVQNSFFIGWEQTVEGHLGIGFDRNRAAESKLFYNVSNKWTRSVFEGALMFRPVFRQRERGTTSVNVPQLKELSFYPNPATDQILLQLPDDVHQLQVQLYDLSGKMRLSKQVVRFDASLQVSSLPSGIYLLKARDTKGMLYAGKLIVR